MSVTASRGVTHRPRNATNRPGSTFGNCAGPSHTAAHQQGCAGHHLNRSPRPGDPPQLLPSAQGAGFTGDKGAPATRPAPSSSQVSDLQAVPPLT